MLALWKKELLTFFSSLTGYLVVFVFLLMSGLFLWILPGNLNIPDGDYATLDGLFFLAPWLFLFLVPAVTMRLFADEKKSGALELLLTRPLSGWQIVGGKFLGGFSLVFMALLPTLVYFYSVWQLAQPAGNVDVGAIWGSYIGLVLLAGSYVSIGLFTSSLSSNQLVAFVLAALLSFLFYSGFEALAAVPFLGGADSLLQALGIDEHYSSISRGVVDSRDLVYFFSLMLVFTGLTKILLVKPFRWKWFGGLLGGVLLLNLAASTWFFRLDLTAEKRYSLAGITKTFLVEMENPVFATVFLTGDLNRGFEQLERSSREMLDELRVYAGNNLDYRFVDPSDDSDEGSRSHEKLKTLGLNAVPVYETTGDGGRKQTLVYPYLILSTGESEIAVNLLENRQGLSGAENLNASIEGLEYKLTDALRRLILEEKPPIAFLEGHDELDELDVVDVTDALSAHYRVERGNPGENAAALDGYKAVIVAKPRKAFTETEKFILDRYLMNGGRVLWLIDGINVTMDSLRKTSQTVGLPYELNLNDQLFGYGFRINPVLVEDLQSAMVPVNVSPPGEPSQFVPMPWTFSPLLNTNRQHAITRHLSLVKSEFVSSIDTVGSYPSIERIPLLQTSRYSRVLQPPVLVSLSQVSESPDRTLFTSSHIPVAYAAEGVFTSVFKNRPLPPDVKGVAANEIRVESVPTRMVVVADGDVIKNEVRFKQSGNPKILPLGFDEITNRNYGNKQFILNAVNYLTDDEGWMALRARNYRLRLLDGKKLLSNILFWKMLNVAGPLLLVLMAGLVIPLVRRRRYGKAA